jgi:hypothetical protein
MKTLRLAFLLLLAVAGAPARADTPPLMSVAQQAPPVSAPEGGWAVEEGLYARVYAPSEHRALARSLADHAARAVPRLSLELGVPAGATIEVYLAGSAEAFERMQPGRPPHWADGTAWPRQGRVFLRAPSAREGATTPLPVVLEHELVHVLLGRAFAAAGSRAPRWLEEGLARVHAGEYDVESVRELRDSGRLPSLEEISRDFPEDAPSARIAYAASADFLTFLRREHGADVLSRLVARMTAGSHAEASLASVTGRPLEALEADWRGGWGPALTSARVEQVALGGGAVAALAGLVSARRRRRSRDEARLERWERQEALEDLARLRAPEAATWGWTPAEG